MATARKVVPLKYSVRFRLTVKPGGAHGYILATVRHADRSARFSIGASGIPIELWDQQRERAKGQSIVATATNQEIENTRSTVSRMFDALHDERERALKESRVFEYDPDELLEEIRALIAPRQTETVRSTGLAKHFDNFITKYRPKIRSGGSSKLAPATVKAYKTTKALIEDFESFRGRVNLKELRCDTPPARIHAEDLEHEFREWLREQKQYNDNSLSKVTKNLNTFLHWVEDKHVIGLARMHRFASEGVDYDAVALTASEIQLLEELPLEEKSTLWHIRNLFLMGCYSMLRFSDWGHVRPELYRQPHQDVVHEKTGGGFMLLHTPEMRRILKLYREDGLPQYATNVNYNAKVNGWIKEICELAGLDRMVSKQSRVDGKDIRTPVPLYTLVTTHTARRTGITLNKSKGVPQDLIMRQSGHKSTKQFSKYDGRSSHDIAAEMGISAIED